MGGKSWWCMGSHSSRLWDVYLGNWEERGPKEWKEKDQKEDKDKVKV